MEIKWSETDMSRTYAGPKNTPSKSFKFVLLFINIGIPSLSLSLSLSEEGIQ